MATTVKSTRELNAYINSICEKAIRDTSLKAREYLYKCVNEQYYNDLGFYPNAYRRTEEFLKHVTSQLISNNVAQVYIDIEGMHYKNNFSPWRVVKWASESKHGSEYYQTDTEDFWTVFIEWCENNLLDILKANLRKYGLKIK